MDNIKYVVTATVGESWRDNVLIFKFNTITSAGTIVETILKNLDPTSSKIDFKITVEKDKPEEEEQEDEGDD